MTKAKKALVDEIAACNAFVNHRKSMVRERLSRIEIQDEIISKAEAEISRINRICENADSDIRASLEKRRQAQIKLNALNSIGTASVSSSKPKRKKPQTPADKLIVALSEIERLKKTLVKDGLSLEDLAALQAAVEK